MKEKWQLAIFAAAVSLAASAATFRVAAPDGSAVCTVTPPDYGAGAVLETTNLTGGVAWRVRFTGTGERTIEKEEWTFDFGEDFRCWPVSHAQGEYIPKTLSTIATMKPMPGAAAIAAGEADLAIGTERISRQIENLDFIPLLEERYDFVIKKEKMDTEAVQKLQKVLADPAFRREISHFSGNDYRDLGKVIMEV